MSVLVLLLVSLSQGVFAKEVSMDNENLEFSQEDIVKLQEGFSELSIDVNTQKKLIEKLENGELLDSMKPENSQKSVTLLETSTKGTIGLNNSQTITFEDGSKIIYGTELVKTDDIGIMKASGSYTVRSYWYTGVLNYSFYTDCVIVAGDNNDYIVRSYNPNVSVLVPGGTFNNEKVSIQRKYETSTKRAYSRMDFNYSVPFGGSTSVDLYFNVGDNDYETTLSLKDSK